MTPHKGSLHLIPNFLAENTNEVIPMQVVNVLLSIDVYFVEEIKSARRFLRRIHPKFPIDTTTFYILNEHTHDDIKHALPILQQGRDIAYLSESGTPCIADPGQQLVKLCHQYELPIKPYVGPNAIMLTLMASGFNGQHFTFHGYLPIKQPALSHKIKEIESESKQKNCTQLFIETPYRNLQLLESIHQQCHPDTMLCIAADITGRTEWIKSHSIRAWKHISPPIHKVPAVFALYAGEENTLT
jgi:Predicted methyltransferases